ncbi:hypothetical protein Cadr_000028680 [Camelus dromedarius]|uniref:Uncharacterized protein n=1 Tax=Camelus dromedarius TaxID=9838 RepID=A0A5N4C828_CAMDR|nr:hypothetical protein Cadr_000028680 [Camelus dromedarius]
MIWVLQGGAAAEGPPGSCSVHTGFTCRKGWAGCGLRKSRCGAQDPGGTSLQRGEKPGGLCPCNARLETTPPETAPEPPWHGQSASHCSLRHGSCPSGRLTGPGTPAGSARRRRGFSALFTCMRGRRWVSLRRGQGRCDLSPPSPVGVQGLGPSFSPTGDPGLGKKRSDLTGSLLGFPVLAGKVGVDRRHQTLAWAAEATVGVAPSLGSVRDGAEDHRMRRVGSLDKHHLLAGHFTFQEVGGGQLDLCVTSESTSENSFRSGASTGSSTSRSTWGLKREVGDASPEDAGDTKGRGHSPAWETGRTARVHLPCPGAAPSPSPTISSSFSLTVRGTALTVAGWDPFSTAGPALALWGHGLLVSLGTGVGRPPGTQGFTTLHPGSRQSPRDLLLPPALLARGVEDLPPASAELPQRAALPAAVTLARDSRFLALEAKTSNKPRLEIPQGRQHASPWDTEAQTSGRPGTDPGCPAGSRLCPLSGKGQLGSRYHPGLLCLYRAATTLPTLCLPVHPRLTGGTDPPTGWSKRGGARHSLASWEDAKMRCLGKRALLPPLCPSVAHGSPSLFRIHRNPNDRPLVAGDESHTLQPDSCELNHVFVTTTERRATALGSCFLSHEHILQEPAPLSRAAAPTLAALLEQGCSLPSREMLRRLWPCLGQMAEGQPFPRGGIHASGRWGGGQALLAPSPPTLPPARLSGSSRGPALSKSPAQEPHLRSCVQGAQPEMVPPVCACPRKLAQSRGPDGTDQGDLGKGTHTESLEGRMMQTEECWQSKGAQGTRPRLLGECWSWGLAPLHMPRSHGGAEPMRGCMDTVPGKRFRFQAQRGQCTDAGALALVGRAADAGSVLRPLEHPRTPGGCWGAEPTEVGAAAGPREASGHPETDHGGAVVLPNVEDEELCDPEAQRRPRPQRHHRHAAHLPDPAQLCVVDGLSPTPGTSASGGAECFQPLPWGGVSYRLPAPSDGPSTVFDSQWGGGPRPQGGAGRLCVSEGGSDHAEEVWATLAPHVLRVGSRRGRGAQASPALKLEPLIRHNPAVRLPRVLVISLCVASALGNYDQKCEQWSFPEAAAGEGPAGSSFPERPVNGFTRQSVFEKVIKERQALRGRGGVPHNTWELFYFWCSVLRDLTQRWTWPRGPGGRGGGAMRSEALRICLGCPEWGPTPPLSALHWPFSFHPVSEPGRSGLVAVALLWLLGGLAPCFLVSGPQVQVCARLHLGCVQLSHKEQAFSNPGGISRQAHPGAEGAPSHNAQERLLPEVCRTVELSALGLRPLRARVLLTIGQSVLSMVAKCPFFQPMASACAPTQEWASDYVCPHADSYVWPLPFVHILIHVPSWARVCACSGWAGLLGFALGRWLPRVWICSPSSGSMALIQEDVSESLAAGANGRLGAWGRLGRAGKETHSRGPERFSLEPWKPASLPSALGSGRALGCWGAYLAASKERVGSLEAQAGRGSLTVRPLHGASSRPTWGACPKSLVLWSLEEKLLHPPYAGGGPAELRGTRQETEKEPLPHGQWCQALSHSYQTPGFTLPASGAQGKNSGPVIISQGWGPLGKSLGRKEGREKRGGGGVRALKDLRPCQDLQKDGALPQVCGAILREAENLLRDESGWGSRRVRGPPFPEVRGRQSGVSERPTRLPRKSLARLGLAPPAHSLHFQAIGFWLEVHGLEPRAFAPLGGFLCSMAGAVRGPPGLWLLWSPQQPPVAGDLSAVDKTQRQGVGTGISGRSRSTPHTTDHQQNASDLREEEGEEERRQRRQKSQAPSPRPAWGLCWQVEALSAVLTLRRPVLRQGTPTLLRNWDTSPGPGRWGWVLRIPREAQNVHVCAHVMCGWATCAWAPACVLAASICIPVVLVWVGRSVRGGAAPRACPWGVRCGWGELRWPGEESHGLGFLSALPLAGAQAHLSPGTQVAQSIAGRTQMCVQACTRAGTGAHTSTPLKAPLAGGPASALCLPILTSASVFSEPPVFVSWEWLPLAWDLTQRGGPHFSSRTETFLISTRPVTGGSCWRHLLVAVGLGSWAPGHMNWGKPGPAWTPGSGREGGSRAATLGELLTPGDHGSGVSLKGQGLWHPPAHGAAQEDVAPADVGPTRVWLSEAILPRECAPASPADAGSSRMHTPCDKAAFPCQSPHPRQGLSLGPPQRSPAGNS